ncbi:aklavinone 12-hydroxylase RdmE [Labedaea rhizosphaerae]|uniref:2-polyprenyl-6-methoxyphenol hydroxylase-like FAD-dependent oxidoreductase n=1 Tax=Labedaea rhizosphaerae TaxID=598644 RepID=A0A4R6S593_LABRH|nr:FAD-dependent oxidoreductase [Labedaea rhizosphaerae]TDP93916.1 2-polyprenyl-6-methoxyphenol hydroxylase-like FAD-dependent oxidoreductase [Labedaea rhizosphaerae]
MDTTQVLVIGAGLAGSSAALFLAQQGIDVTLVEKHPGTSLHPKAAGQYPRTMQLMHIGGVADEILAASHGMQGGLTIKIAESVHGKVFNTIMAGGEDFDLSAITPFPLGMATQDKAEPILLGKAQQYKAKVRFRTEVVSLDQDDTGVTARLLDRDTERVTELRADYVVAADGHRGGTRTKLGIGRQGKGSLSSVVGVLFKADLGGHVEHDTSLLYYLQNPAFTGVFGGATDSDSYIFGIDYHPDRGESAADFTRERIVELMRIALDKPDLEPDIITVQAWEMAAWLADRFRDGRIFLAGDAAKVTPPTGGMGGNTAVQDGYDIAWKLAAVLNGHAGPGLLDSYEAERRPIAEMVITTSLYNAKERLFPDLDLSDVPPPPADMLGLMGGFRYRSAAIIPDQGDDDPAPAENPFMATGRPGFPAPHVPVDVDGKSSTVELFGPEWTLVCGKDDARWRAAAAATGLPIRVYGAELPDAVAAKYGLGPTGASLIRPDAMVAWRAVEAPEDPTAALTAAVAAILDR